jgi:hypothetical protein
MVGHAGKLGATPPVFLWRLRHNTGILKKAARDAAEPTAPPNRQQRRRFAQLKRKREKEEARLGQLARAA